MSDLLNIMKHPRKNKHRKRTKLFGKQLLFRITQIMANRQGKSGSSYLLPTFFAATTFIWHIRGKHCLARRQSAGCHDDSDGELNMWVCWTGKWANLRFRYAHKETKISFPYLLSSLQQRTNAAMANGEWHVLWGWQRRKKLAEGKMVLQSA